MCSWCWGYRNTWLQLQKQLQGIVDIQYRVGGLAADSEAPMVEEMREFLQHTWHKISTQLGTTFNFEFWRKCQPLRSTYPACRAVLIARQHNLEQEMYHGIQQAYYLKAKNPSLVTTLNDIAAEVGIDRQMFAKQLCSDQINQQLHLEINYVRCLPIRGFPSLVLEINDKYNPVSINYLDWQSTKQEILAVINAAQG